MPYSSSLIENQRGSSQDSCERNLTLRVTDSYKCLIRTFFALAIQSVDSSIHADLGRVCEIETRWVLYGCGSRARKSFHDCGYKRVANYATKRARLSSTASCGHVKQMFWICTGRQTDQQRAHTWSNLLDKGQGFCQRELAK